MVSTSTISLAPPFAPLPDVKALLQSSRPSAGPRLLRPGSAMAFLIAALVVTMLPLPVATRITIQILLWGAFLGAMIYFASLVRGFRAELALLDQIEDLLVLKRYPEATPQIQWLMGRPMRADQNRLRAMVLLATLLARLVRHDDALIVYNELIDAERVAGPSGAMVKLGRAMAMLQSDHLYDADRAINDLRRLIDRGGAENELREFDASIPSSPADALAIGALRLIEIYRDIKTGHAQEAVDLFEKNLPALRAGLGHRAGEAHALAAVAYNQLGRADDAARCFSDGTALTGVVDLLNHYPELRPLIASYSPTPAPNG